MVARWFHFFFRFSPKNFPVRPIICPRSVQNQSTFEHRFDFEPISGRWLVEPGKNWKNWDGFLLPVLANLGVNYVGFGCFHKKYPPFYSTTCPVLSTTFPPFYSTTFCSIQPLLRGIFSHPLSLENPKCERGHVTGSHSTSPCHTDRLTRTPLTFVFFEREAPRKLEDKKCKRDESEKI